VASCLLSLHASTSFGLCVWLLFPLSLSLSRTFHLKSLACSCHVTMMPIHLVQALFRFPLRCLFPESFPKLSLSAFNINTSTISLVSSYKSFFTCCSFLDGSCTETQDSQLSSFLANYKAMQVLHRLCSDVVCLRQHVETVPYCKYPIEGMRTLT
jgi:hypothetical protein